jgi:hypothetical protein
MESLSYGGWNCARIVSGDIEAIVTLDVGPRVIRLGFVGGPNEFYENPKDAGKAGGDEYRSYGGHRLWIAPEDEIRTLQPENDPVEVGKEADWLLFRSHPDRYSLQKEIRIRPCPKGFELDHRIYNRGAYSVELAPWALSVMAAGGVCIFPHAPFQPHSENFLPVRPLVLWSYTDMADPRWTWGSRVVRLRHSSDGGPQKVGTCLAPGLVAYCNHEHTFVKAFPHQPDKTYPDMGCNFETFTRHDMLEVESLGPLQTLDRGHFVSHTERWMLLENQSAPEDDLACAEWLETLGRQLQ